MSVVIVYHVWPEALPGGYVGVDVFFVVSGFLITLHMMDEIHRTGGLSVRRFWARRIKRLLPAAVTVLVASAALMFAFVSPTRWQQNLIEIAASSAYVQNWVLAAASVDYLAAENDPSVVQHYWSLSVEEQFYIVWPLLIVVLLAVAAALGSRGLVVTQRRVIGVGLSVIAVTSFVYSLVLTGVDPGVAYFSTATRAWEFAAGGLLAIAGRRLQFSPMSPVGVVASASGFVAIICSCVLLSSTTPFPGTAALVPVLGTVLVLAAGTSQWRFAPAHLLGGRVPQYVGDVSYSAYLWHWPLVVAYLSSLGRPPGLLSGGALVVVTIVLAGITKRFVEDPFRRPESPLSRPRVAFSFALVAVVVAALLAGVGTWKITSDANAARESAAELSECLGARALGPGAAASCLDQLSSVEVTPSLAAREGDTDGQYSCYVGEGKPFRTCSYGPEDASVRLAVTGDSHAASLVPGLREAAEAQGWRLDVYVGYACQFQPGDSCSAREEFAEALSGGKYDAVLATGYRRYHAEAGDLAAFWAPYVDGGMNIVAVGDVPLLPEDVNVCIDGGGTQPEGLESCTTPREIALGTYPDQYTSAAEQLGIPSVDLGEVLCDANTCPSVVGGVLVYRDSPASHITATFSETMDSYWKRELSRILSGR